MYASCVFFRFAVAVWLATVAGAGNAWAQPPAHEGHAPPQDPHAGHATPQDPHAGHIPPPEQHAGHEAASGSFATREASGTAWLPDATPMYGIHRTARGWDVMFHGNAFAQFLYEGGEEHRESHQAGSINWFMGMARRRLGAGRIGVRGMVSLEPWTIPGCGYPDLLATGETCDGDTIHDRQHPHDLFMELAIEYERPLTASTRLQLYGGPAGEPALGPVAFPHRLSAMSNPIAPIGHHWLDATHITYGVATAAVYGSRWKAEASVFNGREPDEDRVDLDLAALKSFSGRVSFLPTPSIVLQASAGHLAEAEAPHGVGARLDVERVTASATWHRRPATEAFWATTVAWGMNIEPLETTHSMMLESTFSADGRNTWFGRLEVTGKPAHALHVSESNDVFTVGKLQAGYARYFGQRRGFQPGVGGSLAVSLLPPALQARYGGQAVLGLGLFVTVRPAAH
jgi:hypothetical protein